MRKVLLRWLLLALSVLGASAVTDALGLGFRTNVDFQNAGSVIVFLIGVAILSFLNATLGSVLKVLTLPISCLTFGIFALVINAAMLMLAASLNFGYRIDGDGWRAFGAAFAGSILIAIINGVLRVLLPDGKDD